MGLKLSRLLKAAGDGAWSWSPTRLARACRRLRRKCCWLNFQELISVRQAHGVLQNPISRNVYSGNLASFARGVSLGGKCSAQVEGCKAATESLGGLRGQGWVRDGQACLDFLD